MERYYQGKPDIGQDGRYSDIGIRNNDLSKGVIIPGDPQRSKIISGLFHNPYPVAERGAFVSYRGKTEHGKDISVMSCGMGGSNIARAVEELADSGVKAVIRVGTCGGLQQNIRPGTIVIAEGCVRGEGASYEYAPAEFPAAADPYVTDALLRASEELNAQAVSGIYRSHDSFYRESPAADSGLKERVKRWQEAGVLCVENESGTLFTLGHLLGLRTGTICVIMGCMTGYDDPGSNAEFQKPEYLQSRIIMESRIAIRAIEILQEEGKI